MSYATYELQCYVNRYYTWSINPNRYKISGWLSLEKNCFPVKPGILHGVLIDTLCPQYTAWYTAMIHDCRVESNSTQGVIQKFLNLIFQPNFFNPIFQPRNFSTQGVIQKVLLWVGTSPNFGLMNNTWAIVAYTLYTLMANSKGMRIVYFDNSRQLTVYTSNNVPRCIAAYSSEFNGPLELGGPFSGRGDFFLGGRGDLSAHPLLYHTLQPQLKMKK